MPPSCWGAAWLCESVIALQLTEYPKCSRRPQAECLKKMSPAAITKIVARQIFDSRGNPTVQVCHALRCAGRAQRTALHSLCAVLGLAL